MHSACDLDGIQPYFEVFPMDATQKYSKVSQASIIRGLIADGAVEQTVLSALCSEEALAPWTTTNEVISELHLAPSSLLLSD